MKNGGKLLGKFPVVGTPQQQSLSFRKTDIKPVSLNSLLPGEDVMLNLVAESEEEGAGKFWENDGSGGMLSF